MERLMVYCSRDWFVVRSLPAKESAPTAIESMRK